MVVLERRSIRQVAILVALVFLTCPAPRSASADEIAGRPSRGTVGGGSVGGIFRPLSEDPPSIMSVPPEKMFEAFSAQYENRPDARFLLAFETLIKRHEQLFGKGGAAVSFRAGVVTTNGKEIGIPLLLEGQVVVETRLPVLASFPEVLKALGEWAAAMDRGQFSSMEKSQAGPAMPGDLDNAIRRIETPDPRVIASGLGILEKCWRNGGRDAKVLKAAALGYGMLLLVLEPDTLGMGDPLAAEGMVFLALARRIDPGVETAREESLLARGMGYRARSFDLSRTISANKATPDEKALDAFLKRDRRLLSDLSTGGARVMGSYLLARMYREGSLSEMAEKASEESLKATRAPFFPLIVERIRSADVGTAKFFTLLYPMLLLDDVEGPGNLAAEAGKKSLKERMETVPDDKASVSISAFEDLIRRKVTDPEILSQQCFMDAQRLGLVYRYLYAEALVLRFDVLQDRWGVPEKARTFAESVDPEKTGHPLALFLQARSLAGYGDRKTADSLFEKIVGDPRYGGELAYQAYIGTNDSLARVRLLPIAARRLDGRPEHRLKRGYMFRARNNLDLAAREYASGLREDPYSYWVYRGIAQAQGSNRILNEAIEKQPGEFGLLQTAGVYLVDRSDPDSKQAGEAALRLAQSLQPSSLAIARKRAQALRELKRYDEAIKVYNEWLARHDREDLGRIIANAFRARNYVEKGEPGKALEILGRDWESYQQTSMSVTALANEKAGNLDNAADLYRKALERYSTSISSYTDLAGFHWRMGKYEEAAKILAKGRLYPKNAYWYVSEFFGSLQSLPDSNILLAVKFLKTNGATNWELQALSRRLSRENRREVAFRIASEIEDGNFFNSLDAHLLAYKILRADKGMAEAMAYLKTVAPSPEMVGPFTGLLYKQGLFEEILWFMPEPGAGAVLPESREFAWLQKLIAWLALGKNPAELGKEFDAHYIEASSLSYHFAGRFLLGRISRDELLKEVRTEKQRCEFAYYIGLAHRLQGSFAEAAQWYHLCLETLLSSNGEFRWAGDELHWWAGLGTEKRNRLVGDDADAYFRTNTEGSL